MTSTKFTSKEYKIHVLISREETPRFLLLLKDNILFGSEESEDLGYQENPTKSLQVIPNTANIHVPILELDYP